MSKKRWTLFTVFLIPSLACLIAVVRMGAANPTTGTIAPNSQPLIWNGSAVGGTNNGEATCVEGVNCDTFTLTVSGLPTDWTGKTIQINVSWIVLANDYDVYVHKLNNAGPVVSSSTHGAPSASETVKIDPTIDGTGVFTVRVVYFTGAAADQYHAVATVVPANAPAPSPPPLSPNWNIVYHGTCCEGNLAAAGANTFVLLPELATGNDILKSADDGKTWVKKYPLADVSAPYGIEGDLQAFGDDVIFFGTELADGVAAHSDDRGESWVTTQFPVPFVANDQAWAFLGPFGDMVPGQLEPYVLAGWFRIGSVAVFSFDGGLTWPVQSPLPAYAQSLHVVCENNARAPTSTGDTRISNGQYANKKAGRHGAWGTDRKFYWTEPTGGNLYVCKSDDFGVTWDGIKHPIAPGPGSDYIVTHAAFDSNGTLYVLHGNKLYVSFNQGESLQFVHSLPRWGDAGRADSGADQFFVINSGTIHIALMENAGEGRGRVYYLRGTGVDTATPTWDEELVDVVDNVRLDFMQIVLNGNGVPTISYTTPDKEVTTASRKGPMPVAAAPARLLNISTRAHIQTDDNVLIGGFIITGTAPKKVIVRALGPSLGLSNSLADPILELHPQADTTPIGTNDNWKENQAEVEATTLAPTNDAEAALVQTLGPGAYTVVVRGKDNTSGVGIVEAFDLGDAGSKLANISSRGFVEINDNVIIGGFIAGPASAANTSVVVRGLGPSLKNRLPAALNDTVLELRDVNGALLEENDDWQQSPGAAGVQNNSLTPASPAESAIFVPTLLPGPYTVVLRGKNATTGIGVVEIFNVP
ncbi:MAG TPA: hypothetical protein VM940_14660 [Chthoniobacterales bacterium]|jgi:hypothetical protein|nr:hypothetical protein [Chthoniobacterales bacterium]